LFYEVQCNSLTWIIIRSEVKSDETAVLLPGGADDGTSVLGIIKPSFGSERRSSTDAWHSDLPYELNNVLIE
jgi:hypothetical protein